MAEDRRLTYTEFLVVNKMEPTVEYVEDGYLRCVCGNTMTVVEYEMYKHSCNACELKSDLGKDVIKAGSKLLDQLVVRPKFGRPTEIDRPERMADVIEIPVGQYNATRTLRHLLALAEKGRIARCLVVVTEPSPEDEPGEMVYASWSDMTRHEVLWMTRWLNTAINRRYFHGHGPEEGEDDDERL